MDPRPLGPEAKKVRRVSMALVKWEAAVVRVDERRAACLREGRRRTAWQRASGVSTRLIQSLTRKSSTDRALALDNVISPTHGH